MPPIFSWIFSSLNIGRTLSKFPNEFSKYFELLFRSLRKKYLEYLSTIILKISIENITIQWWWMNHGIKKMRRMISIYRCTATPLHLASPKCIQMYLTVSILPSYMHRGSTEFSQDTHSPKQHFRTLHYRTFSFCWPPPPPSLLQFPKILQKTNKI